jgi:hypothetical protein
MIGKFILGIFISINLNGEVLRNDSNQVVFDTASKLMWQDNNDAIYYIYTWENAISYCENLNFSGATDWRVPNINELYTLVDFTKSNPAINTKFINTISNKYWTSTSSKYATNNAWYINFTNGLSAYQIKSTSTLVRCVRDIN